MCLLSGHVFFLCTSLLGDPSLALANAGAIAQDDLLREEGGEGFFSPYALATLLRKLFQRNSSPSKIILNSKCTACGSEGVPFPLTCHPEWWLRAGSVNEGSPNRR